MEAAEHRGWSWAGGWAGLAHFRFSRRRLNVPYSFSSFEIREKVKNGTRVLSGFIFAFTEQWRLKLYRIKENVWSYIVVKICENIYPKRGLIGLIIMDPNDRPEICPLSRRLKGQIFDFFAREKTDPKKRLRSPLHINLTTPGSFLGVSHSNYFFNFNIFMEITNLPLIRQRKFLLLGHE